MYISYTIREDHERLIGICRNLSLPISADSHQLSILSNHVAENIVAVVIIRYYCWMHSVLYSEFRCDILSQ